MFLEALNLSDAGGNSVFSEYEEGEWTYGGGTLVPPVQMSGPSAVVCFYTGSLNPSNAKWTTAFRWFRNGAYGAATLGHMQRSGGYCDYESSSGWPSNCYTGTWKYIAVKF